MKRIIGIVIFGVLIVWVLYFFVGLRIKPNLDDRQVMYVKKGADAIVISHESDIKEYLYSESNDVTETVNFKFKVINEGLRVYVLDELYEGEIIRIGIIQGQPSYLYKSYEEAWIWNEYVVLEKGG